jgi:tetratricopeptide (TPR) repeat protein
MTQDFKGKQDTYLKDYKMKALILLSVILCISIHTISMSAQTSKADSMEKLLQQYKKNDTIKVNLLNHTALELYQIDNDRLLQYAEEAIKLADRLKYQKGKAEGLRLKGRFHYGRSENIQALEFYQKSLNINEEIGNNAGISACLNNIGLVHWKLGDYSLAMENFQKSYSIAEQLGDKNLISSCLKSFGILNIQLGDYQKAIEYFQKSIELGKATGDKTGISDCMNNIGYIHMRQGNYPQAVEYFQKTIEILEEIGNRKGISGIFLNIGIIQQNQGNFAEAIENYHKASLIYEEFGDKQGISMCLNNIGLIYQSQGNYPQALDYILNSLKTKEEIGDKRGISSCMINIGAIHADQGDSMKAIEYFQKSLQILEELNDKRGISNCQLSLGKIYGNQGNYTQALEFFQSSLKTKEEIGDKSGIADCLHSIGNMNEILGNNSRALVYYQKSLRIREELEDKTGICLLFSDMGKLYLRANNYVKALDYTRRSLDIAYELDLLEEISKNHKLISEIYFATGNYRNAYENLTLHKEFYDSIFNEEKIREISGLEYQYIYEKEKQAIELEQQKKDALQAEEAKQQKIIRNSFITGFVLMALVALMVLRNFLQKRRDNKKIVEQNDQILKINEELKELNETAHKQNDEILSSIKYAQRIQSAILPPEAYINELLNENFIFYRPKEIVSGDFYWIKQVKNYIILVCADCTGHGVPGAFMSMLGISCLNEIVQRREVTQANLILNELRKQIKQSLRQSGEKELSRDGMDMALCVIDLKENLMQYSGAYIPLYIINSNNGEPVLKEIKADAMPVGVHFVSDKPFTNHEIHVEIGDNFYISSDGFIDQTGGTDKTKFNSHKFKKLLLEIHNQPMYEQRQILDHTLEKWMGLNPQRDDILVIGFRVS